MSFVDFATVMELASIEQIVDKLGLKIAKREPTSLRCECAVHGGGQRALTIAPNKLSSKNNSKGVFFCNVQKAGGDRIGLAAHCLNISQNEAANWIAQQFGSAPKPKPNV